MSCVSINATCISSRSLKKTPSWLFSCMRNLWPADLVSDTHTHTHTHTQVYSVLCPLCAGYSVLSLVPTPHFKDGNIGAYIGKEVCGLLTSCSHYQSPLSLPPPSSLTSTCNGYMLRCCSSASVTLPAHWDWHQRSDWCSNQD